MAEIKVLVIEPIESIANVISNGLEKAIAAQVVCCKTSDEAIGFIVSGEKYSLIIARNMIEETKESSADMIAKQILNALYDLSDKTPLIIIGDFEHTYKKYAIVSERLRVEEIVRLSIKALGLKKEDFEYLKLPDYIAYPVKYFYLMTISPCDVYIKLVKKTGDDYVKRLNLGEHFSKTDLLKYEELGLKELYIQKDEYEDFMNGLLVQSIDTLKTTKDPQDQLEVIGDSVAISTSLIQSLGITPVSVVMVDLAIGMITKQIQNADKLGKLLQKMLEDKMSYSYRRAYLICLLSHSLIPKMEWGRGEQQASLFEKICLVSYFHDIYLKDEKLQKISSLEELKAANLNQAETEAVLNHAYHAATLIQSYPRLPQGVDLLIKQHHGNMNGVGLPESMTAGISPMAIFFIVVEDFAAQILSLNDTTTNLAILMRSALVPLKIKYELPSYRKVVNELENLISPKK